MEFGKKFGKEFFKTFLPSIPETKPITKKEPEITGTTLQPKDTLLISPASQSVNTIKKTVKIEINTNLTVTEGNATKAGENFGTGNSKTIIAELMEDQTVEGSP